MTYEVIIYEQAQMDLANLAKSEPKAFAKAQRFIEELKEHPSGESTVNIYQGQHAKASLPLTLFFASFHPRGPSC